MPNARVFVANLPYNMSKNKLKLLFNDCGAIDEVVIPFDYDQQCQKNFAFVNFKNEDSVAKALELSGSVYQSKNIRVQRAERKS
jgi:nucleolin